MAGGVGLALDAVGFATDIGLCATGAFEVDPLLTPFGFAVVPGFALSWNRDEGVAGRAPSASIFALFGREAGSGSSDFRFTPAAALFGVSLAPFDRADCGGLGAFDDC